VPETRVVPAAPVRGTCCVVPPHGAMAACLADALQSQWATMDKTLCKFFLVGYFVTLWKFTLTQQETAWLAALITAFAATWAGAALAPERYLRLRRALIAALRLAQQLLPLMADVSRVLQPAPAAGAQLPASGSGALAAAVEWMRAAHMLVCGISWLHGSLITSVGLQLPPVEHLAIQLATSCYYCWRATHGKQSKLGPCTWRWVVVAVVESLWFRIVAGRCLQNAPDTWPARHITGAFLLPCTTAYSKSSPSRSPPRCSRSPELATPLAMRESV
jgi:hypothetical protein